MKKSLILKIILVFAILLTASLFAACIDSPAIEENIKLQVNYISSEGGYIDGEITQSITYGNQTNEVTAIPYNGYKFVKWSDGKKTPYRQDIVIDNFSVTAEFEFLFEGGDGSAISPFVINNYDQLLNIVYYPTANYKLAKDLYLENIQHKPIFDGTICFNGCFDGNGNTVYNLNIISCLNFSSLFGFIGNAGIIKNLNLSNVSIIIPNSYNLDSPLCIGTVAGVSLGVLSNINIDGEITCDVLRYGGIAIGGLVGQSQNIIDNCCTNVQIKISKIDMLSDTLYVGGLVGITEGDLFYCESNGRIDLLSATVQETADITIGGLAGVIFISGSDVQNITINECTSSVAMNSEYDSSIGGLLGVSIVKGNSDFFTTITNCSATGDIVSLSGNVAGFICACNNNDNALFYNCHSTGNVTNYNGASSGFIGRGRGVISYCSATGNVKATSYASGFCDYFTGKIFRSFANGNVQSQDISCGFGRLCGGIVEECFCTGTVDSTGIGAPYGKASGFFFIVTDKVINCFSTSDVIVQNNKADVTITAVGLVVGGTICNSYYAGKITINNTISSNSILGALTWGQGLSDIINCHWLYYEDSLVDFPFISDRNPNLITEVYHYDTKQDMCTKAVVEVLNNGENNTWIWVEDDFPNLRFFVETYK